MNLKSLLHSRKAQLLAAAIAAVLATLALGLVADGQSSRPQLLHVEPSEFAPVVVFEQYGERCINFNEMEGEGRQTCMRLDNPRVMVFEYTRMMTSALLVKPDPASVLIIGLGGGTLPTALHELLPEAVIDTVEIDPAVVEVAQTYFSYKPGPRQRVFVEDGRAFVERALQAGQHYDMVMLDAFDVDYIPPHLLTVEFLTQVREVLTPDGLVVANSFAQSRMYVQESATYAAVFGEYYNQRAGLEGNRVIIAANGALPPMEVVQSNAQRLAQALEPYGIDTKAAVGRFSVASGEYDAADVLHDAP